MPKRQGGGVAGDRVRANDVQLRMNYLLQASAMLTATRATRGVSRLLAHSFKSVASRNVQRVAPAVKRTICKRCSSLLVPGRTATHTCTAVGQPRVEIMCHNCRHVRVFLMQQHAAAAAAAAAHGDAAPAATEGSSSAATSTDADAPDSEQPCAPPAPPPSAADCEQTSSTVP